MVVRVRAPETALQVAPWNAQAAGRLSQQLLVTEPNNRLRAGRLADQALRRDPTIVMAVVTRGALQEAEKRPDLALRSFTYAEWLSRRNLAVELWWIEYGVARGDVAFALRHYDIALRAIKQAPDILFPILSAAVSQADVRQELVTAFRREPAWKDRFLEWLIGNGVNNRGAAALFREMGKAGRRPDPSLAGRLERGLAEAGDFDTAWEVYRQTHPRAVRHATRDDDFGSAGMSTSPFDWDVVDEQGAAAISSLGGDHALTFATVPTSGGVLARQLQLLPAGRYRLTSDVSMEGEGSAPRPYWTLRCFDGRELGRVTLRGGNGILAVPADCPAQWLTFAVDAGDAIEGARGVVRSVSLAAEPVR